MSELHQQPHGSSVPDAGTRTCVHQGHPKVPCPTRACNTRQACGCHGQVLGQLRWHLRPCSQRKHGGGTLQTMLSMRLHSMSKHAFLQSMNSICLMQASVHEHLHMPDTSLRQWAGTGLPRSRAAGGPKFQLLMCTSAIGPKTPLRACRACMVAASSGP